MNEWKLFRNIYIAKFNDADKDKNLRLTAAELIEGIKDISGINAIITNTTLWDLVVNDISARHTKDAYINFKEYVQIRATATAWCVASGMRDSITREELLDIGLKVYPHFNPYEGQLKHVLFSALDFQDLYVSYTFLDVVNLLNTFTIFESMRKHSSITGSLDKSHLIRAIQDQIGPTLLFEVEG